MERTLRDRYPGTQNYTEKDEAIFFGRDKDIINICNRLKTKNLLVVFAESGVGKSSLINAGVIPHLKKSETKKVYKINARRYANIDVSLLSKINRRISEATEETTLDFLIDNEKTLWHTFKNKQLTCKSATEHHIIIDHFEEFTKYTEEDQLNFKIQLSELLSQTIPVSVQQTIEAVQEVDENFIPNEEYEKILEPPKIKITLIIRSDKFSSLNYFTDYFPQILNSTYELKPLNIKQIEQVIVEPAKLNSPGLQFASKPFRYSPSALKKITTSLTEKGREQAEMFQLQMVCSQIEKKVRRLYQLKTDTANNKAQTITVTPSQVPDVEEIFGKFYNDVIRKVVPREEEPEVRRFIEEGLVLPSEQRRLTIYEGQITKKYNIDPDTLTDLANTRLIRTITDNKGGRNYELSHDSLILPITNAYYRRKHKEETQKKKEIERQLQLERKQYEKIREKKEALELDNRLKTTYHNANYVLTTMVGLLIVFTVLTIVGNNQKEKRYAKKIFEMAQNDTKVNIRNLTVTELSDIKINYIKNSCTELDMYGTKLSGIDKTIGQMQKLETANFAKNQLNQLPKQVGEISTLKRLSLQDNPQISFAEIVSALQLSKRKIVLFNNNKKFNIGQPQSSELFVVFSNQDPIPDSIYLIQNLTEMHLTDIRTSKFSRYILQKKYSPTPEIAKLSNLEILEIENSNIATFPKEVAGLSNLKMLNLSNNPISEITVDAENLKNLEYLDISGTDIANIPTQILNLPNLKYINLRNCENLDLQTLNNTISNASSEREIVINTAQNKQTAYKFYKTNIKNKNTSTLIIGITP